MPQGLKQGRHFRKVSVMCRTVSVFPEEVIIRHGGAHLRARREGALENGDDFGEQGRHLEYGEGTDGDLFVNEDATLMKTPGG